MGRGIGISVKGEAEEMLESVYYSPFSFLNLSHASFNVLKTAPAIIFCSVVALTGICRG